MCKLVRAFLVPMQQSQVFLRGGSYDKKGQLCGHFNSFDWQVLKELKYVDEHNAVELKGPVAC